MPRASGSTRSPRPRVPGSGVITGFGAVSGDLDSRTVLLDRRRVATILESDRATLGLHVDMTMTEALAEAIATRHEYRLAWRAALQRLARKARTVREIRDSLLRIEDHISQGD